MLLIFRNVSRPFELLLGLAMGLARLLTAWIAFNPRLGPLRHVATLAVAYVAFAVLLVYVVAPVRGIAGQYYLGEKLRYDAERWLATAIYDQKGSFVGTFDARLDSQRDVNFTDAAIEVADYTANPDHKSIPVRDVPEHYWQCLVYQEDRYLGGWLNPFGIDLAGVLKIPYSTLERSLALRRPSLGVGGSTLPMQLTRVIYKTPPHSGESGLTKLRRKLSEWWLAPVVYRELTMGGDATRLKQWAANHLWLAQRTGGTPLHGVEVTSRVVFGKEAKDLTTAEQFVLASAVNKPIILLEGSERLNAVRLDRWRYITEVRARTCAEKLLTDENEKKQVLFELIALAGGPPDPKVRPRLQAALERYAPAMALRAEANPEIRANALMPSARFGLREEMKHAYGFGWREHVRGVTTTFEAAENLAFGDAIKAGLARIDTAFRDRMAPGYTLDPAKVGPDRKTPDVIVVAANAKGEIVRYYEAGETASYFGSLGARSASTGFYDPARDPRMIASTGKMIAAIAIANGGKDTSNSLYLDTQAPEHGLETCAKGSGRYGRRAIVAFACSLNAPLLNRAALAGQARVKSLIDAFGFNMPPGDTPPSTAAVLGQISGAPRRVHQMSAVILAALIGRGSLPVKQPTLVSRYDYTGIESLERLAVAQPAGIIPNKVIRRGAAPLLRALLSAPLCYTAGGAPAGTLKSLSRWCAARHGDVRLHFAKTGTQVTADPNATVDVWTTGGIQFANGAAYSYVVLTGTGSANEPWGTSLHAAQVAAPLLEVLLNDLAAHAKANPMPSLLPPGLAPRPVAEGSISSEIGQATRPN
jgi:membrane peptidoglycan carboxypeptidase